MIAANEYKSIKECVSTKIKDIVKPNRELSKRYDAKYRKFSKLYPNLKKLYEDMR